MDPNEKKTSASVPGEAKNEKNLEAPRGAAPPPANASEILTPAVELPGEPQISPEIEETEHRTVSGLVPEAMNVVRVKTTGNILRPLEGIDILSDADAEKRIRRMSRRSFLWGAAAVAGIWGGLEWLGTRRLDNGVQWPFRRVLEVNENLSRDLFSGARLAPEFPKTLAQEPRPNGDFGVASENEPDWKLRLVGLADMSAAQMPDSESSHSGTDSPSTGDKKFSPGASEHTIKREGITKDKKASADEEAASADQADAAPGTPADTDPAVLVTLAQIQALPKSEIVTELKCIEGWSTIVQWKGVQLAELMHKYPPATKSGAPFDPKRLDDLPEFVSMETPDGQYYVGLDMASALHPQTLLCYEMNGKPLEPEHGAPLRLVIPVKYGIKNIKHIGTIKFTDERPKDYWAERGYDWYAGH